jgi:hypothetical protein
VQLQRWNKLKGSHLTPGRMLAVSEPIHLAPRAAGSRRSHGKHHGQTQPASRGGSHPASGPHSRSAKASGGKKPAAAPGISSSNRVASSSGAAHSAKSTTKKAQ